jgi:hypothetical protein
VGFEGIQSGSYYNPFIGAVNEVSSSAAFFGTHYSTTIRDHEYVLPIFIDTPNSPNSRSFMKFFNRPLPSNKFMRIHMTARTPFTGYGGYYNILVKGVITKEEATSVDIYKIRSV